MKEKEDTDFDAAVKDLLNPESGKDGGSFAQTKKSMRAADRFLLPRDSHGMRLSKRAETLVRIVAAAFCAILLGLFALQIAGR